jgi:hypothetical protein
VAPLVNLPEVAIVGLGRVMQLPRYDSNGSLTRRAIMTVSGGEDELGEHRTLALNHPRGHLHCIISAGTPLYCHYLGTFLLCVISPHFHDAIFSYIAITLLPLLITPVW